MTATKPEVKTTGENVSYSIEGDELVIRIDLTHRGKLSASGKTVRVASSEGNARMTDEVIVGLNAYVKA